MLIKQVHEYYRNKVKIQEQLVLWCISMLYKLLDLFRHSKMCSTFLLSIWMNSIAHWTCLYHRKPKNTLFLPKKGNQPEGNSLEGTTAYYYYTGNYSLRTNIQVSLGILWQINKEVKRPCLPYLFPIFGTNWFLHAYALFK